MWRLLAFFAVVVAVSIGIGWFVDRPGAVNIDWLGYSIQTSVAVAVIGVAALVAALLALWWLLSFLLTRPGAITEWVRERRHRRGLQALSRGMIAVGAGDRAAAARYAALAKKALPNEPMTALLRAQAAQLNGERARARALFEAMVERSDTELLGLRGLYLEAKRENELDAARHYVDRAVQRDPTLSWSTNALFELQCRAGEWADAIRTLASARINGLVDAGLANRRRAVLLTAQALEAEDEEPSKALALALEAHKLAPELVPAAEVAGRILGQRGETRRATSVIAKTWRRTPHPDLARAYAFARPGDAPKDRLRRIKRLAQLTPGSPEAAAAVAAVALEARDYGEVRAALKRQFEDRPTARICILMARLEAAELGDKGREREWLARSLRAPRDPVWMADGVVSDRWAPISPVTGALDAFEWKVPPAALAPAETERLLLESLEAPDVPAPGLAGREGPTPALPAPEPETTIEASVMPQPNVAERMAASSPVPDPVIATGAEPKARDPVVVPLPEKAALARPTRPDANGRDPQTRAERRASFRAPDDPGVDLPDADPDEPQTPLARYRLPVR